MLLIFPMNFASILIPSLHVSGDRAFLMLPIARWSSSAGANLKDDPMTSWGQS